jgi:hypothetical protein
VGTIKRLYLNNLAEDLKVLSEGAAVVEVKVGKGDFFALRERGIVLLGHHPGDGGLFGEIAYRSTAEQAVALMAARPDWVPSMIVRSLRPINSDDALACAVLDPETRERVLHSKNLPRLLFEIGITDLRGPSGFSFVEEKSGGMRCLLNAVYNRMEPDAMAKASDEQMIEKAKAFEALLARMDELEPEEAVRVHAEYKVVRDTRSADGATIMVDVTKGWAFDELYRDGYDRVIVLGRNSDGTRRCTVGQAKPLVLKKGLLVETPPLDFKRATALETDMRKCSVSQLPQGGWGGRATIGGSPKDRTELTPDQIWDLFVL